MSVRTFTYIRIKQSQPQWPHNLTRIKKKARANFFLIFVSRRRLKEGENQSEAPIRLFFRFDSNSETFRNFCHLGFNTLGSNDAMPCHATPSRPLYTMPRQATPRQASHSIPCHAMPFNTMPQHAGCSIPCHAMQATPYHAPPCRPIYTSSCVDARAT